MNCHYIAQTILFFLELIIALFVFICLLFYINVMNFSQTSHQICLNSSLAGTVSSFFQRLRLPYSDVHPLPHGSSTLTGLIQLFSPSVLQVGPSCAEILTLSSIIPPSHANNPFVFIVQKSPGVN